jgi:hypothetical protein
MYLINNTGVNREINHRGGSKSGGKKTLYNRGRRGRVE